jgi:5-methylcytosine-specific restriction endonuclease McrA
LMKNKFGIAEAGRKYCNACGVSKPVSSFYKRTDSPGVGSLCCDCLSVKRGFSLRRPRNSRTKEQKEHDRKERANELARARYRKNRESVLARTKAWQKANPEHNAARAARRRARLKTGDSHTADDIKQLFFLQRGACACCRSSIKSGYHVDHVIPLAKGGGNERANIQLLCPPCNSSKGHKDPVVFMQQRGFLL